MAPARSWRCRRTTSATGRLPGSIHLPIREVIAGGDVEQEAFVETERGTRGQFHDAGWAFFHRWPDAGRSDSENHGLARNHGKGQKAVNYKLRDWLFARQRYWGEPFPIVWVDGRRPSHLPEEQLPLVLPETTNFKPSGSGESPLANLGGMADDD